MNKLERLILDQIRNDAKSLKSTTDHLYPEQIPSVLFFVSKIKESAEALQESEQDWNKITKLGVSVIKEKCEKIEKLIEKLPNTDERFDKEKHREIFSEVFSIQEFEDALREFGFAEKK